MSKDELIAKQQLQIEEYKQMLEENSGLIKDLKMRFYAIGQPLNDNVLMFNKKQLSWCFETFDLVEQLNGL
jgi:hypothetical protein